MLDGHCTARHLSTLTLEVGQFIESSNFQSGVSGWRLDASGDLEANDGTFRGNVEFATGGLLSPFGADGVRLSNDQGDVWVTALAAGEVTRIGVTNDTSVSIGAGTDGKIGFFGTAPADKQVISGSTGGNAALQDLLSKLAFIGLITNSTT